MSSKLDGEAGLLAAMPGLLVSYFMVMALGPVIGIGVVFAGIGMNFLIANFFGKDAIIPSWICIIALFIAYMAYTTNNLPV